MISNEIPIKHPVGLHARPAALFVQAAQKFTSKVTVTYNGKTVNAKSVLAILSLGVSQGAVIVVNADGADEAEASNALKALVDANFGERL